MKRVIRTFLMRSLALVAIVIAYPSSESLAQCNLTIVPDSLQADYNGSPVGFCVDLAFEIALRSDRYLDGVLLPGLAEGCEYDTLSFYPYGTFPDLLDAANGPYRLQNWLINGTSLSGDFSDINDLITLMNALDPTGNWVLDNSTFNLVGGDENNAYGQLTVQQQGTGIQRTANPNTREVATGTLVVADGAGFHSYVIDDPDTGCRDTLSIFLRPTIDDDILQIFTDFNTTTTQFCLDNSDLLGTPQAYSICGSPNDGLVNDLGGYCFTYTPDAGTTGSDNFCFEVCDDTPQPAGPLCKRTFVEVIVRSPSAVVTDTFRFGMTNTDTTVCINDLIDIPAPYDVAELCDASPVGINAVPALDGCISIQPDATFSGEATFCVRYCNGASCDTTIVIPTVFTSCNLGMFANNRDTISSQGNPTPYCISVEPSVLQSYEINIDGQPYAGQFGECDFSSQFFYNYAPLFGSGNAGPYTLVFWRVNGTEFSGTFDNPTELEALMRQFDPAGDWRLMTSMFSIRGGDNSTTYERMRIIHNASGTISNLDANPVDVANGSTINLPGDGEYLIEVSNPVSGCTDNVTVFVGVPPPTGSFNTVFVDVEANSFSPLSCLFASQRDTLINCGDTQNGTTAIDASACVVYTPILGFTGNDTLCAITCDLPGLVTCDTTIMIFEVRPRIDTVFIDNFGDAPFSACGVLPFAGPYAPAQICGTTGPVLAEAGNTPGCITIDPNDGATGTAEICAVICQDADPTICQEFLFIVTQTPSCIPSIFSSDTLFLPNSDDPTNVCLADGLDLSDYTITLDGNAPTVVSDTSCGTRVGGGGGGVTRDAYFYGTFLLPDGEYRIEGWDINSQVLVMGVSALNFAALADSMSTYDPTLQWEYDDTLQGIVASGASGNYSPLILFDPNSGATFTVGLQTIQVQDGNGGGQTFVPGTSIQIPGAGLFEVEVIANDGSCGDRLVIAQRPAQAPMRDTIDFAAVSNETNGPFCLPVNELPGALSTIESCGDPINGTLTFTSLDCFTYAPNLGFTGPDTACVVICSSGGTICDTTVVAFTVSEQVVCDEIWSDESATQITDDCDASEFVCLPRLTSDFFNYTLEVDGVLRADAIACGADTLTIYSYADVAGDGQAGPYAVENYLVNGQLRNTTVSNVDALVDSINIWDPQGQWMQDVSSFTIRGGVSGVDYNTLVLRQIATDTINRLEPIEILTENQLGIAVDTGFHEVVITDTRTGCTDTLELRLLCDQNSNCTGLSALTDTELTLDDCDDQASFEVLSATTDVALLEVFVNGIRTPATVLDSTIAVFVDTGETQIIVIDPEEGCSSTFEVTVTCTSCTPLFSTTDISRAVNCASSTYDICLPILPDALSDYAIAVNGQPYTGSLEGCDEREVLVIDYSNLSGDGIDGPYSISAFTINAAQFSTDINDIFVLADTLSAWDATGDWQIDTAAQILVGGNVLNSYSDLSITQISSGQEVELLLMQEQQFGGTQLILSPQAGAQQLTFSSLNGCSDTINLTLVCVTSSEATDTVNTTESVVFCVDDSELTGPIVSFENVCPTADGDVVFDFDGSLGCVTATGVNAGQTTACLVACDASGVCDTTFYTVVVNADAGDIIAVDDVIRIRKGETTSTSLTANDTFNVLTNATILVQPFGGTAFLNPNGMLTYTPDQDLCGFTDTLVYEICQGEICDQARVSIRVRCDVVEAYSGFSPNGDGVNDQFIIEGILEYPEAVVQVYNRWGARVYETTGYQNDWEGMWDDSRLVSGTYFYLIDIEGEEPIAGYVQLWR